jgi:hypothetical protein
MSVDTLKLIPVLPEYVPGDAMLRRACDLLESFFPGAKKTSCETTAEVRFIDQGQNWERVICPVCETELEPQWWAQAMDRAHQAGFADLRVNLPCCGAVSSLNDLQYELPAGFARVVLSVRDPDRDIDDKQLETLENVLGCKLRKIWARY